MCPKIVRLEDLQDVWPSKCLSPASARRHRDRLSVRGRRKSGQRQRNTLDMYFTPFPCKRTVREATPKVEEPASVSLCQEQGNVLSHVLKSAMSNGSKHQISPAFPNNGRTSSSFLGEGDSVNPPHSSPPLAFLTSKQSMTSVRWNGIDGHSVLSLRTPSSSSSGEYWDAVGELDEHELEVLMEEVDSMQCFDPPVCRASAPVTECTVIDTDTDWSELLSSQPSSSCGQPYFLDSDSDVEPETWYPFQPRMYRADDDDL